MTLVRRLAPIDLERKSLLGAVEGAYPVFEDNEDNQYLQRDSHGSPARPLKGKQCQAIQLDAGAAGQLMAIDVGGFG